jgi:Lipase (class 3)
MIEAINVGMRGSGAVGAPDVAARLRSRGIAEFDTRTVPPREGLIWTQPQPVMQFAQVSNQPVAATSVQAPATRELALLAADVYHDAPSPPTGYRVATEADLGRIGLKPQDLTSSQSAFRARVYVKGANESAEYVVAFRGSTSSTDWQANLRQGVGLSSDHYTRALIIGRALARNPQATVTITGHSLGGGLASAAAIASGRDATTFNAAGLSNATITKANGIRSAAGIGRAAQVQAFYVRGEVLSAIQDGGDRVIGAIFGGVTGATIVDAPSAYGTRHALTPVRPAGQPWYSDNPVAKHGMDWVLSSLGIR